MGISGHGVRVIIITGKHWGRGGYRRLRRDGLLFGGQGMALLEWKEGQGKWVMDEETKGRGWCEWATVGRWSSRRLRGNCVGRVCPPDLKCCRENNSCASYALSASELGTPTGLKSLTTVYVESKRSILKLYIVYLIRREVHSDYNHPGHEW